MIDSGRPLKYLFNIHPIYLSRCSARHYIIWIEIHAKAMLLKNK